MRLKKAFFLSIVIALFSLSNVFAYSYHQKGDFQLSLRLPLSVPTFTSNIGVKPVETITFGDMGYKNIIVGIEADIGVFTSSAVSVGGILGYNFAYDRGENLFSRVPLLFKFNYFAVSSHKNEVPLSLGIGVNYFKYRSMEHIVPQLLVESGFNIYWTDNWSASFRTGINLYAELYADSKKNNISATIPLVFGVTYRK